MPKKSKAREKIAAPLNLSELCSEAAQHVAKARAALFDDSYDAEQALRHLDDAIACLKRLLAHGTPQANGARANGSTAALHSA